LLLTGIQRLGPPDDLCPVCKKEIRQAHEAAGGELIDPDEPYDDLKRLHALVQLNPNRSLAYAYRAMGHWKRGNREQAIADLTKAIELGPGSKTVACYHNRGVMLIRVGEFRRAISDLERCVELEPDGIANLSALAWVLATCPAEGIRDGSRAVELAQRACELTNWKDAVLDTLAAASAESGQFDRASEWEREAVSLAGEKETKEYRERLDLYGNRKPYRDSR
jgi:tetratricopeptide (TPR) repeat protein